MSEPIPTNPTPTAVPWTPDMMAPQSVRQVPTAAPVFESPQYQPHQGQPSQAQQQPQFQSAQAYIPQVQPQPHMPAQPQLQQPQYLPTVQTYPQMAMPNPHNAQPHYVPAEPFVQPGPPPLAPHMQAPLQSIETPAESKSLFAKLLKRSPKAQPSNTDFTEAEASGSLFNKNFLLGAITGLIIGAFVLPMALNLVGGNTPSQAQAQAGPPPVLDVTPTMAEGGTFIDNAIASDAP